MGPRMEPSKQLQEFKEKHNIFTLDSKNTVLIKQMAEVETLKETKKLELARINNAITLISSTKENFQTPEIFAP